MKRFNITLGDPQAERLERDAGAEDISVSELVRRIVSAHYKRTEQECQATARCDPKK
jgi:hypothetical protein